MHWMLSHTNHRSNSKALTSLSGLRVGVTEEKKKKSKTMRFVFPVGKRQKNSLKAVWRSAFFVNSALKIQSKYSAINCQKYTPTDCFLGDFSLLCMISKLLIKFCWHHYFFLCQLFFEKFFSLNVNYFWTETSFKVLFPREELMF